jgi:hypothetical protein
LTQDTDTEVDCVAERLDSDDTGICEDSDSGSDSENNDPPPEPVPFVPAPTEPDVSAMPLDLEHLNASARGVMDTVHASQREIRANPHRSRLPARKEASRHIPDGAHVVSIPKAAYNTARRVLVSESLELPLVTVSMRADIQFFHRKNRWVLCFFLTSSAPTNICIGLLRYRLSKYSLPNEDGYKHVVDATMISDTAVVAYGSGPTQISLLPLIEVRTCCQIPSLL